MKRINKELANFMEKTRIETTKEQTVLCNTIRVSFTIQIPEALNKEDDHHEVGFQYRIGQRVW